MGARDSSGRKGGAYVKLNLNFLCLSVNKVSLWYHRYMAWVCRGRVTALCVEMFLKLTLAVTAAKEAGKVNK